jgi:hypothetical protein
MIIKFKLSIKLQYQADNEFKQEFLKQALLLKRLSDSKKSISL